MIRESETTGGDVPASLDKDNKSVSENQEPTSAGKTNRRDFLRLGLAAGAVAAIEHSPLKSVAKAAERSAEKPDAKEMSFEEAKRTISVWLIGQMQELYPLIEKEIEKIISQAGLKVVFGQPHWINHTFCLNITKDRNPEKPLAEGWTPVERDKDKKVVGSLGYVSVTKIKEAAAESKDQTVRAIAKLPEVLARALGRAGAHELIHWLANKTEHSTGLMKGALNDDLFREPKMADLSLDKKVLAKIEAELGLRNKEMEEVARANSKN